MCLLVLSINKFHSNVVHSTWISHEDNETKKEFCRQFWWQDNISTLKTETLKGNYKGNTICSHIEERYIC